MASVFARHESNRARLGRSRKTSCWPLTTPQTLQELERALLEEWDRIPQLVINSLIDFMPQSKIIETEKKIRMVSNLLNFTAAMTQVRPNPHDRAGNEIPSPTSNINRV
ncbi:hypothetical protein TNCV_1979181 [Trichonephila clavipes]|nr:hypothetical protein TNCV_1979181 [Trichonephila clavipes]